MPIIQEEAYYFKILKILRKKLEIEPNNIIIGDLNEVNNLWIWVIYLNLMEAIELEEVPIFNI